MLGPNLSFPSRFNLYSNSHFFSFFIVHLVMTGVLHINWPRPCIVVLHTLTSLASYFPPPRSICSSHTGLLSVHWPCCACVQLKALALAFLSTWNDSAWEIFMALSLPFRYLFQWLPYSGRFLSTSFSHIAFTVIWNCVHGSHRFKEMWARNYLCVKMIVENMRNTEEQREGTKTFITPQPGKTPGSSSNTKPIL